MESLGVISKVEKSTDWVNGMVLVGKPNSNLRICLDSRPLNKAVRRHHYPIPTVEEITSKMEGATYFAKLDASSGYWQVKVDEGSADLLTFSTPFGRYRFNRMSFGIISASEIFQREVEKVIEKVNGAISAQDDIIIWGMYTTRMQTVCAKCVCMCVCCRPVLVVVSASAVATRSEE